MNKNVLWRSVLYLLIRYSPILIPVIIAVIKKPKLSKTQKNFRRKMNKLVKRGKIKDQYGITIKQEKEYHNPIIIIGIILLLIYICYILKTNYPVIIEYIKEITANCS